MKKIAFAIENFSRFGGGAESYAVCLAETMIKMGWEVHFFGVRWDGEPKGAVFHPISIPFFLPQWAKILLFALRHKKMVQPWNFDVILGFGNTISMNVYQSHGGVHWFTAERKLFSEQNTILRFFKRLMLRLSLKQHVRHWIESAAFRLQPPPVIVAISDMVRKDFVSYYGVDPSVVKLVYNGVDGAKFRSNCAGGKRVQSDLAGSGRIRDDCLVFLFVSYELKKKGILPLLHAINLLKNKVNGRFKLLVVGGDPGAFIKRRVVKLGIEDVVIFYGASKNIQDIFAISDVLVLPTYYDACSLVVFEAMMSGVVPVTTDSNGAAGVIMDGVNGYVLSHPPSAKEIFEKLEKFFDNERLKRLSEMAVDTGKRYTIEKNHENMLTIFDGVCVEKR